MCRVRILNFNPFGLHLKGFVNSNSLTFIQICLHFHLSKNSQTNYIKSSIFFESRNISNLVQFLLYPDLLSLQEFCVKEMEVEKRKQKRESRPPTPPTGHFHRANYSPTCLFAHVAPNRQPISIVPPYLPFSSSSSQCHGDHKPDAALAHITS